MEIIQRGFWSGALANGPMTLMFFIFEDFFPPQESHKLPPASLTAQMTRPLGSERLSRQGSADLTMIAHFVYSFGASMLYAKLTQRQSPQRMKSIVTGASYGFGVWAVSYLGWIQIFRLKPRATNLSPEQNLMMIAAHLIWGASLGYADCVLKQQGKTLLDDKSARQA